jgi:hypothetical protein
MKKIKLRLAKWLYKQMGYSVVAIRAKNGTTDIISDGTLLSYVDIVGFITQQEPAITKRVYPQVDDWGDDSSAITKLTEEVLAEIEATTEPFPEKLKKQNETID